MAQNIGRQVSATERAALVRQGLGLVALSITWMVIEGVISVGAGIAASSVALLAFGVDSFIELASDLVVWWRLRTEQRGGCAERVEEVEQKASRLAGVILWVLAAYITFDAGRRLLGFGEKAHESLTGIAVTGAALVIMPALAWGKLRIANALDSRALRTDAYEAVCCAWLSVTTLAGLGLNALFGWWWADPMAALVIVPLLIKEGREGWRGGCSACGHPQ
jgi:divalent metal cation (Fe/Co/Zn/Cd) transporter